jgi:hypothetical protein
MATTINAVTSAGGGLAVTGDSSGVLGFQSAGTTYMTMDASGNLGIGTSSPSVQLQATKPVLFDSSGVGVANNVAVGVGSSSTGLFWITGNSLGISTNGTERMRIDSSGNVGVGNTTPSSATGTGGPALSVSSTGLRRSINLVANYGGNGIYGAALTYNATIDSGAATNTFTVLSGTGQQGGAAIIGEYSGDIQFCNYNTGAETGGTRTVNLSVAEKMRISSGGNVLIGTTAVGSDSPLTVKSSTTTTWNGATITAAAASGNGAYPSYLFNNSSNARKGLVGMDMNATRIYVECNGSGGVYLASAGTSWTAVSDEREKDIIENIENAAEKVSSLRAVIGKYKTDEEGTRRAFLIAQDVQAVLPEAVDASDPDKLGVQYTDTIPLLVAAIKEQQAIIEQLKADVEALKGAK